MTTGNEGNGKLTRWRKLSAEITPSKWTYQQFDESVYSEAGIRICTLHEVQMKDSDGFFIAQAPEAMKALLEVAEASERLYKAAQPVSASIGTAVTDAHHIFFEAMADMYHTLSKLEGD